MKKVRIGLRLDSNLCAELDYFVSKFGCSRAYVLELAYKLSDRKMIERLLSLEE